MKRFYCFLAPTVFLLLLLNACGGSSSSSGLQQVKITENEFAITTSLTKFAAGIPYHFVITNNGKTTHEFMIMPKTEGTMSGMGMNGMDKMALAKAENIAPGQTAEFDYTFGSDSAGTHPEFACYYPGHYESGMKQEVTISS